MLLTTVLVFFGSFSFLWPDTEVSHVQWLWYPQYLMDTATNKSYMKHTDASDVRHYE